MKQIFLAPRSNELAYEHFESTIIGGRPYSFIEPFLTAAEKKLLSKYKTISVWGNKESLKSRWAKMRPGDYVLFYAKGVFYYSARVVLIKFSEELSAKLWPLPKGGKRWNCLFFVDNLKETDIPIRVIQELAEYEPTWDRVQGFMQLRKNGVKAIVSKFGDIESFINQDSSAFRAIETVIESNKDEILEGEKSTKSADKNTILAEAKAYKSLDESTLPKKKLQKIRKENRRQKSRVAYLENYTCQLCGWSLEWTNSKRKKAYRIDIDHIVDKALGGGEELDNLWALCPNCHTKKTLGVIIVDIKKKKIFERGKEIKLLQDNHLHW